MKNTIITILAALLIAVFAVSAIQAQDPVTDETPAQAVVETTAVVEETENISVEETLQETPQEEITETETPEPTETEEPEQNEMDSESMEMPLENAVGTTRITETTEPTGTPAAEASLTPEATVIDGTVVPTAEPTDEEPTQEVTDETDKDQDLNGEEQPAEQKDGKSETAEQTEETETEPTEEPAAETPTEEPIVEPTEEPTQEPEEKKHGRVIVNISGEQVSAPYNGASQSVSGYTVVSISDPDYSESDIEYTGDASASRTEIGLSYMGLNAGMFSNKNEEFEHVTFVVTDGFIEVTPLEVEVLISGTVMEAVADGSWFVAEGYEARQVSPADMLIYDVRDIEMKDGYSARAEGEAAGSYPMNLSADAFENKNTNFDVTFIINDGSLEIKEAAPAVTEPAEEPIAEPTAEPTEEEPVEAEPTAEQTEEPTVVPVTVEPAEGEATEEPAEGEGTEAEELENVVTSDDNTAAEAAEEPADGEEEPEEPAEEEAETFNVIAGTEVYDENGELLYTAENDLAMVVLEKDEEKVLIALEDGTVGYIYLAQDEEADEPEAEEPQTLLVPASTDIRLDADGMSEIIFTLDEDAELTILEVGAEWVKVALADGTIGYIYRSDVELPAEEAETEDAPAALPVVEKKVTIFTSRRSQMELGEEVRLTSRLEGFEDCTSIKYQWECDKGNGFEAVEGADGDSYSFEASVETLSWSWRLTVYYR